MEEEEREENHDSAQDDSELSKGEETNVFFYNVTRCILYKI